MKTWAVMYLLVWIAFAQILIIVFPVLGKPTTYYLHSAVGVIVVAVAMLAYSMTKRSACPQRIKRISKTTAFLAVFQGVLGLALLAGIMMHLGSTFRNVILFLHVVNAIAIITQAASSSTAYDMWEEKEFLESGKATLPATGN